MLVLEDLRQGTPEWFDARRGIPTASHFGEIITPAKGDLSKSADGYIAMLIDEIVRPDADEGFKGNQHTERGHELEPKARNWYAFTQCVQPRQVGFIMRDDGMAGCSPDALIGEDGGLEIKCPDGPTHIRYLLAGSLPDAYKPQVHGNLAITGREWWDFLSYCPGYKPLLIRVLPDDYTEKVVKALDQFVERLIAAKQKVLAEAA